MRSTLRISDVRFKPALGRTDGLLGFVSFEHGAHIFDGVSLHKTADGRFSLTYPRRLDRAGIAHPYVRPSSPAARAAITADVVAELRARGLLP